ncbi:MAG: hypothetical protein BWX70_03108 [Verrucomicrobia bacterium ADurb.Bin070]|nr:MAG: hypothetical protein BWX70_03108 [Verrucomicrobia bacterium ADurb.Bin070]
MPLFGAAIPLNVNAAPGSASIRTVLGVDEVSCSLPIVSTPLVSSSTVPAALNVATSPAASG